MGLPVHFPPGCSYSGQQPGLRNHSRRLQLICDYECNHCEYYECSCLCDLGSMYLIVLSLFPPFKFEILIVALREAVNIRRMNTTCPSALSLLSTAQHTWRVGRAGQEGRRSCCRVGLSSRAALEGCPLPRENTVGISFMTKTGLHGRG